MNVKERMKEVEEAAWEAGNDAMIAGAAATVNWSTGNDGAEGDSTEGEPEIEGPEEWLYSIFFTPNLKRGMHPPPPAGQRNITWSFILSVNFFQVLL